MGFDKLALLCFLCGSVVNLSETVADRVFPFVHGGFRQPAEYFFEFQTLDHYERTELNYWKQRYFVNDAYRRPGGPLFLLLGGQEAANPAWLVEGAMVEYAKTYGALMVMLEHRYYGKSRPVGNLELDNLKHLSSAQALADIAKFIPELHFYQNVSENAKIILFGGGYAGALATWFRSKYPYIAHGAVATSPTIVASDDFSDYLLYVSNTLDTVNPRCREEIKSATSTMYEWWGQPDKRIVMRNLFRLCDKIDHDVLIDVAAFFYTTATNFAKVVEYNHVNRTLEGLPGGDFTIEDACDVMTETWGTSIERYAKVQSLVLDQYRQPCLNARFYAMMEQVNQTDWDSYSAEGGRQWLYQICTEFGWSANSMSYKQPFGGMFNLFPLNFTNDQCFGAFGTQSFFSGVYENCEETNRIYGGLDMSVSNVAIVNGDADPWRSVSATTPLSNAPGADIILISGTAHRASMYPPSNRDLPQLVQARARISVTIGKWLHSP